MTRVGWIVLAGILIVGAAFASMIRIGSGPGKALPQVRFEQSTTVPERAEGLPFLQVPVAGVKRSAIADTWGQARSEGRQHHGTDIMARGGTPVLAAADGTIEKLFQSRLGGTTLYERSLDRSWVFYYAHLQGYASGLHEGQRVHAGEAIAYVGDTGDAGSGNFHLHFSLTRVTPEQRWYQGEDVNPWSALTGR